MAATPKHIRDLYKLFSSVDTPEEAADLLQDILTPQELESLAVRWQEVQMIAAGFTQREVAKKLGISISKVTRGSRQMQFGTGGFKIFLKKLGKTIKE